MKNKVRWGIAGLGNIAHRFVKDLTGSVGNAELYAVAARDLSRAQQFSEQYGCDTSYGSYAELAADSKVDAIYIATIHPFHKKLIELFLNSGKHVLVEKPALTNLADWDAMAALAQEKGLLLAEAMKSVTFPAYREMKQFIRQQNVTITSVEASFGSWHEFDSTWHLFNPTLCGGATLDVGVYGLWLYADLCQLAGVSVTEPQVEFVQDNPLSEVDENATFTFSGALAGKIGASITRDLAREAMIRGPELEITIHGKWWNPTTIDITYQGQSSQISMPVKGGGFSDEIEHVSSLLLINETRSELLSHTTSRRVVSIMEKSLREGGYAELVNSKR
ncbi:Gfo/Idh/MocA family protein [Vibrio methylphosphonaticus]|uniref:Gfo/Idh/MocA family protein n=1 Tax=Vibrio methylphosphonaticus TaxID=2946866 RepID=UPI00202A43EC|nr:Gfo/Idh/MocA family oxidoreductase [Vibrio methylphosphonaticus]MCL9776210.1 Gfo/Idh/MocA family oxidoreductase [Vibrio methylphosphonaticus]